VSNHTTHIIQKKNRNFLVSAYPDDTINRVVVSVGYVH
jgi:hypothetical protein